MKRPLSVDNEFRLNVDEQQDNIKHLKYQCDIDNEDEIRETRAVINPKKKKASVCNM